MYLICEKDRALPIAAQEAMAATLGSNPSFRCAASHFPFLSVPEKVADGVEVGAQQGARRCRIAAVEGVKGTQAGAL